MNKFAQEYLENSKSECEKFKKYPELKLLNKRWSELLTEENTINLMSEFGALRWTLIGYIDNYEVRKFKELDKYIIGKFTDSNEFDDNKRIFQIIDEIE